MSNQKTSELKVKKQGPGRPAKDRPRKEELQRLYVDESRSIREIAEILRCSKDMVYRSLGEYDFELRPRTRRSQLRTYEMDYLRNEVKRKGFKQAAVELGVGVTTLREYLRD